MIKSKDYRVYGNRSPFENILEKKEVFFEQFKLASFNRAVFKIIHLKKRKEHREFKKIYGNRCSFCGKLIKEDYDEQSEIDHFNPNYKKDENSLDKLFQLSNLVYSCKSCNDGKIFMSRKQIDTKYYDILNPDKNINSVFYRDDDFSIKIHNDYLDDTIINEFYVKLHFRSEIMKFYYIIDIFDYYINFYGLAVDEKRKKEFIFLLYNLRECIRKYKRIDFK